MQKKEAHGEAIASSMLKMASLKVPVISIVIGEGSSGGALAIGVANEVVMLATKQAQDILDNATNEANSLRLSVMTYADGQLKGLEELLSSSIETSKTHYDNLLSSLQGYLDVVSENRSQLFPAVQAEEVEGDASERESNKAQEEPVEVANVTISTDSEDK